MSRRVAMLLVIAMTGMSGACSESWFDGDDGCWYQEDESDGYAPLIIETAGLGLVEGEDIRCGERCVVQRSCDGHTLAAIGSGDTPFLGWSGDCTPRVDGRCDVSGYGPPRGDNYVIATFGPTYAEWSRTIADVPSTQAAVRSGNATIAATGFSEEFVWPIVPCSIYQLDDEGAVGWQLPCGAETVGKVSLAPTSTGVVFAAKTTEPITLDGFTTSYRGMVVADVTDDGDVTRLEQIRATKLGLGNVATGEHTALIATMGAAIEYHDVRYELPPSRQSQILLARRANDAADGAFTIDVLGTSSDDAGLAVAVDAAGRDWLVVSLGGELATTGGTVGPGPALLVLQGASVVLALPLSAGAGLLNGPALLRPTADGDMIVGLAFSGSLVLDGLAHPSEFNGALVARIAVSGDVAWAHSWEAGRQPQLSALVVQDDRVFLTGTFYESVDIGGQTIVATSGGSNLIASFDASTGAVRWLQRVGNLPSWTSPDAGLLLVATPTTLFGLGSGPTGWGGLRETSGLADGTSLIRYVDGAP